MRKKNVSNQIATTASRFEPPAYAALRIVSGVMFLCHGTQKLFDWPAPGPNPAVFSQFWVGGVIEFVTGLLIALGLFVRPAAFLACGTMAVAFFQFHWKLGAESLIPLVNKGELSVLYCFVFLLFWARGAGIASLDLIISRRR
jgi:putative oxidoreductase